MTATAPVVPAGASVPHFEDRVVLVVDDSKTIRHSAEALLRAVGVDVRLAEDGYLALERIVVDRPAAIFADVMMPRLDGYQLCALLKQNPDYRGIPIVLLTSKDGLFDRARGRLAGCDDYLTKPFGRDELLEALARQLRRTGEHG
ncbi:MAG: response regulator [Pseudomonadota bacterium]|nr:response regulator [Pseudomonadota bacterium]HJO34927.1 response regulator [Gammaproteobacteria bacterium]